jgi:hypothetical protein
MEETLMCHVGWDDEGPAFWNEKTQRARKEYRCACCTTRIGIGEQYVYTVYTSERGDKPSVERSCIACDGIAEEFGMEHEGKPFPRAIHKFVAECVADGDEESQRWKPMLDQIEERRRAAA